MLPRYYTQHIEHVGNSIYSPSQKWNFGGRMWSTLLFSVLEGDIGPDTNCSDTEIWSMDDRLSVSSSPSGDPNEKKKDHSLTLH